MKCLNSSCHRREFLRMGLYAAAGMPLGLTLGNAVAALAAANPAPAEGGSSAYSRVAIVSCKSYGPEVKTALRSGFDLIGGIQGLVKNKIVTVKINLTGTVWRKLFGRPAGETFMTHEGTVLALCSVLFANGARRVRLVESTNARESLEKTLVRAGWDVNALTALGTVEFENTRNLGLGRQYAQLKVPSGGHLFSSFELNHAYADTDVLVSLAKLKNHEVAGVTLCLKNLFGIAPNSIYGDQAPGENALAGRGPLHDPRDAQKPLLPGEKTRQNLALNQGFRVPRVVADLCAARPIHLSVIDGITSMSGGEGWWSEGLKYTAPGVLIAGFDPVATDAVGTAVMGYSDPQGRRGINPFIEGDNHLVLAEQLGVGTADLKRIEVLGLSLKKARCAYP